MALLCFHQLQPHIPEALRQVAFDDSIYAEKLERSKTKLPIYSVAAAGMICRFILSPLYCFIFGETTDDGESISWQNGGRARASFLWMGVSVGFGTAVLSLSIVFRYLGPMSISECVCSFLIQYPCLRLLCCNHSGADSWGIDLMMALLLPSSTHLHTHPHAVRCSSVPLRPTPFVAAVGSLKQQISSPTDFLRVLTRPESTKSKNEQHNSSNSGEDRIYRHGRPQQSTSSFLGGRHLMPPLPLLLAQLIFHAVMASIFANVVQTQFAMGNGIMFACLVSSVLTFVFTIALDGKSHEIEYHIEQTPSPWNTCTVSALFAKSMSKVQGGSGSLLALVIFLPSVVSVILSLVEPGVTSSMASRMVVSLPLALSSACISLFVCAYLVLVDQIVRHCVAASGLDVDRLLCLVPGNTMVDGKTVPFVAEDLLIQSIIYGCDGGDILQCKSIVDDLSKERLGATCGAYSISSVSFNYEEEEVRRNDAAMDAIAKAMLPPQPLPASRGRALEEDVLRIALLESLGGATGGGSSLGSEVCEPSHCCVALRKRLLASEEALAKSQSVRQPLCLPLLRALLAASGGFGQALCLIYSNGGQSDGFVVPPGAFCCAEYGLRAAAQMIALNIRLGSSGKKGYLPRVSLMSPALFHSAYRLRLGVLACAQHQRQLAGAPKITNDLGNFIALGNCPDIARLLDCCDSSAKLVLTALEERDRERECQVLVHSNCKAWLAELK